MSAPGEGEYEPIVGEQKKRVCYFFDSDIGNYHYGPVHVMKPTRIRMTHSLVMNYGLYKKMEIFRAKPATKREMSQFHTDEYVDFLYRINPENANSYAKEQQKYNVGDDCPIFDGLFEYCSISAGGSMEGAARLSRDKCDIAVNWAGGLHHAKKAEASGFCYVNDIVLGILELLRYHQRVMYIDIDVHHGDGVEEAFYTTDRVMTLSFHKYGEFFPGTGDLRDIGIGKGKTYALNVPLRDGITDDSYKSIFESVVSRSVEWYKPTAIVLQCGADSLAGDKLGYFNLSLKGHADCVQFVKQFNLPLLLLGGGGYTLRATSRAWAYETGLAAGVKLCRRIPANEYFEHYGPNYELDVRSSNMEDLNTPEYLAKIQRAVYENLREKEAAPGIQMMSVPKLDHDDEDGKENEDMEDPDVRINLRQKDARIQRDGELSDSEDEGLGGRKHRQNHGESNGDKPSSKRKGQSPEKSSRNGTSVNGSSASRKSRSPQKSPVATTAVTLDPEAVTIPPPVGTVVGTGAIVPTDELKSKSVAEIAEEMMKIDEETNPPDVPAATVPSKSNDPDVAPAAPSAVQGDRDVDMDAVNNEIKQEKATGQIEEVGIAAKSADFTTAIAPAPTRDETPGEFPAVRPA